MYLLTTHLVDVFRLTKTGAQEAYAGTPAITGLDCAILPASTDTIAVFGGENAYALYEIFFDEVADLRPGDKLTAGSAAWIVRGVPQVFDNDYGYAVHVVGEKVV